MPERLITNAVNAQRGNLRAERQKELEREQRGTQPSSNSPHGENTTAPAQEHKTSPRSGVEGVIGPEATIAQMIIRHGEKVMCYIEDENGQEVPLSVAEYISYSLQDDNIHLQSTICQKLLKEAVENAHAPNFHADQYFINHPDEAIRSIALLLGPESVELSKLYEVPSKSDQDPQEDGESIHLDEVIPSLIASYKLGIVQKELKNIIEQMKDPAIKADLEKVQKLKEDFRQKTLLVKELAKACGDSVVLK